MNYYRIYDVQFAGMCDEFGSSGSGHTELICSEYPVLKETPCGVWISLGFSGKRFIKRGTKKRYACSTKEDALESFRARKRRQISILKHQLEGAELALSLADLPEGKRHGNHFQFTWK